MKVPFEKLKKMLFFTGFSEEIIEMFSENSTLKSYKAGEKLINENSEAREFFVVINGEISISAKDRNNDCNIPIQHIGHGDVLGWSWIFPPYAWSFDAIASTDVDTILIDAAAVRRYCEKNKAQGYDILKRFSKLMSMRLLEVRSKHAELLDKNYCLEKAS